MRLKLQADEMTVLAAILREAEHFHFTTDYENRLTMKILKKFLQKRVKQMVDGNPTLSFKLTETECLALDYVLKQANSEDPFSNAVLSDLRLKINRLCLSI